MNALRASEAAACLSSVILAAEELGIEGQTHRPSHDTDAYDRTAW